MGDFIRVLTLPWIGTMTSLDRSAHGSDKRAAVRYVRDLIRMQGAGVLLVPDDSILIAEPGLSKTGALLVRASDFENRRLVFDDGPGRRLRSEGRRLRIAFLGTRGVPASYSGFETFVEELGVRLANAGHGVMVFCRKCHGADERKQDYRGMRTVHLPALRSKHFETLSHTFLSMLVSLWRPFDVVILCGVGNAPLAWIPRAFGSRVIFNVDGSDWKRAKWGRMARFYLKQCEKIAVRLADVLVADCSAVEWSYQQNFRAASVVLPYGGDLTPASSTEALEEFGLERDNYILFVGRLVPENNAHQLIEAWKKIGSSMPLVIVGDAPYAEDYKKYLRSMAEGVPVVFTGYQFGKAYRELSTHARLYVIASEVGGTHPVLVEQMSIGNCIVANDIASNCEVLGDAGVLYSGNRGAESLGEELESLLARKAVVEELRSRAKDRADRFYSWRVVSEDYKSLINRLGYGETFHARFETISRSRDDREMMTVSC